MFGSCLARMLWGRRASDAASDQIARAIGHRLSPGWSNEGKIGDHGEASATMSAERREQVTAFLNRKENECGGCQTREESKCEKCGAIRCQQCSREDTACEICDVTWWEGTSDMTRREDKGKRKRRQARSRAEETHKYPGIRQEVYRAGSRRPMEARSRRGDE